SPLCSSLSINVPILRESNSATLIQIVKRTAETSNFKIEVYYIPTYPSYYEWIFHVNWILDLKNLSKPKITGLTVCLSSSQSSIPTHVICQGLEYNEVSVGQVMMAFSRGINLNSDMEVQQALTRTLMNILEKFFTGKLNSDEETHAVKALVRSYISHITLKPPHTGNKSASKDDRNKLEGKKTEKESASFTIRNNTRYSGYCVEFPGDEGTTRVNLACLLANAGGAL
ncbi:unnamed protein product, partial [Allacma fusca]